MFCYYFLKKNKAQHFKRDNLKEKKANGCYNKKEVINKIKFFVKTIKQQINKKRKDTNGKTIQYD